MKEQRGRLKVWRGWKETVIVIQPPTFDGIWWLPTSQQCGRGLIEDQHGKLFDISEARKQKKKFLIPGNESLPSRVPRSVRMTDIKWIQLPCRRGRLLVLVSSFTSAVDMFPMTLLALSITASDVSPSSLIKVSASVNGRSPLKNISYVCDAIVPETLYSA